MSKEQRTHGNHVRVKMDPANDYIKLASGFKIAVDTSYDPDKHVVRIGEVTALPDRLNLNLPDMPWHTNMELKIGDRVIMYYLAVQNCIAPEQKRYIYNRDTKEMTIFIKYHNIYGVIRDGVIIPINGFVFVERIEDPEWIKMKKRVAKNNLEIPDFRELSKTNVAYGRVAYIGKPNWNYKNRTKCDDNIDVKPGDEIAMKKIRDIPIEYEYHARIDGDRKLLRMQRHDILAKLK